MRLNYDFARTQIYGSRWIACCAAILAIGCATTEAHHVWIDRALAAETLQAEGELQEARRRYEQLLPEAPDEERRRWLQLNFALLEIEAGRRADGEGMLRELADADVVDLYGANASYELAQLADRDGDVERSHRLRIETIERFPTEVAAEFALDDIVARYEEQGRHRELHQLLDELHVAVRGTDLGDNVLFAIARNFDQHLDRPDDALDAYRRLYDEYRKGPLADDALWEIAAIYRRHQNWVPAVQTLTILAEDQEESWFVGSYDSNWVDDAIYDLGMIHLLFLHDYGGAIQWFERYLKDYPLGFMNDDAAWHIVQAHRLGGEVERHREALAAFVETFPESRYARTPDSSAGGAH